MNASFTIPPCFHPAESLLGRRLRAKMGDPRQSESVFIVVAALIGLALLLGQYLGWALLQPSGAEVVYFVLADSAAVVLFAAFCLIGRRPAIHIHLSEDSLFFRSGARSLAVPIAEIRRAAVIDPQLYHRHYARYASTTVFVNRIPHSLLLIETPAGAVVLGAAPDDAVEIESALAASAVPAVVTPPASVV